MHHLPIRAAARALSTELTVHYPTIESAISSYPNCQRTALRAYARSEAARLANKLIRPKGWDQNFANVVALFADPGQVASSALRSRRFDFVIMLMQSGRFEQRIARRLVREGKLDAGVLS